MSLHAGRRIRSSREWNLVLLDRLAPAERASLPELPPDTYGVLVPGAGGSKWKVVGADAALLFLTLREPSVLPTYVSATFGPDAENAVAELIAEGILETEIDGAWTGGPAAFRARPPATDKIAGGTSGRSLRALIAAAALPADDEDLAVFLYRYGSTPIVGARAREWVDAAAIHASLRLDRFAPTGVLSAKSAWWFFPGAEGPLDADTHKLYVGVTVGALAEALECIGMLRREDPSGAPPFKVGASTAGLHRPDRLVLYPRSASDAADWGARLADALAAVPADPVAFTAAVDSDGRVSRGVDPPQIGCPWWRDDGSWRSLVTTTLAAALVAAQQAGDAQPWRFALDRVRLAGVDPETWSPVAELAR